jgi:hypothetical protein
MYKYLTVSTVALQLVLRLLLAPIHFLLLIICLVWVTSPLH